MPVTPEGVARLLGPLEAVRPVTIRKMFGGIGLYCEGVFFAVIDDDRLYLKTDPELDPAFDAVGAAQWVVEGPSGGPMPYRECPPNLTPEETANWIDAAVAAALRRKSKPKRRP